MTHYTTLVQQLPRLLQPEIAAHLGSTEGMSEVQIATRYRDVALWLKSVKLAALPTGYQPPPGHLTAEEFNWTEPPNPHVSPEIVAIVNTFIAYESAWHLQNFINQLDVVLAQLHEAARQHAQRQAEEAARQLAQRQAEEAARQLAQRQAEEAARLHAQRQAEELVRQLAQRKAEEAAQLGARQLAQQQAEAAAYALAQRKAKEAALEEIRLALELSTASKSEAAGTSTNIGEVPAPRASEVSPVKMIGFIPGPAAMAKIEQATLMLKHSIDSAVAQYASAISPYLNGPAIAANAVR